MVQMVHSTQRLTESLKRLNETTRLTSNALIALYAHIQVFIVRRAREYRAANMPHGDNLAGFMRWLNKNAEGWLDEGVRSALVQTNLIDENDRFN